MNRAARIAELNKLQQDEWKALNGELASCKADLTSTQRKLKRSDRKRRKLRKAQRSSPKAAKKAKRPRSKSPLAPKKVQFAVPPALPKTTRPPSPPPKPKTVAPVPPPKPKAVAPVPPPKPKAAAVSPLQPVAKVLVNSPQRGCLGHWVYLLPQGFRMTFKNNAQRSATDNKRIVTPAGKELRSFKAIESLPAAEGGQKLFCVSEPWARKQSDGGKSLLKEKSWVQEKKDGTTVTSTVGWVEDGPALRAALRKNPSNGNGGVSLPAAAVSKTRAPRPPTAKQLEAAAKRAIREQNKLAKATANAEKERAKLERLAKRAAKTESKRRVRSAAQLALLMEQYRARLNDGQLESFSRLEKDVKNAVLWTLDARQLEQSLQALAANLPGSAEDALEVVDGTLSEVSKLIKQKGKLKKVQEARENAAGQSPAWILENVARPLRQLFDDPTLPIGELCELSYNFGKLLEDVAVAAENAGDEKLLSKAERANDRWTEDVLAYLEDEELCAEEGALAYEDIPAELELRDDYDSFVRRAILQALPFEDEQIRALSKQQVRQVTEKVWPYAGKSAAQVDAEIRANPDKARLALVNFKDSINKLKTDARPFSRVLQLLVDRGAGANVDAIGLPEGYSANSFLAELKSLPNLQAQTALEYRLVPGTDEDEEEEEEEPSPQIRDIRTLLAGIGSQDESEDDDYVAGDSIPTEEVEETEEEPQPVLRKSINGSNSSSSEIEGARDVFRQFGIPQDEDEIAADQVWQSLLDIAIENGGFARNPAKVRAFINAPAIKTLQKQAVEQILALDAPELEDQGTSLSAWEDSNYSRLTDGQGNPLPLIDLFELSVFPPEDDSERIPIAQIESLLALEPFRELFSIFDATVDAATQVPE